MNDTTKRTEHTPGPWHLRPRNRFQHGSNDAVEGSNGWFVAEVCRLADGEPTPEAQANARLIAAAPDLLAAAEDLCAALQFTQSGKGPVAEARLRMRAAIARARGEDGCPACRQRVCICVTDGTEQEAQ